MPRWFDQCVEERRCAGLILVPDLENLLFARPAQVFTDSTRVESQIVDPKVTNAGPASVACRTVLNVFRYPSALPSLGNRKGPGPEIASQGRNASTAISVRGTSATRLRCWSPVSKPSRLSGSRRSFLMGVSCEPGVRPGNDSDRASDRPISARAAGSAPLSHAAVLRQTSFCAKHLR